MSTMNRPKIFHDKHLILEDDAKFVTISEEVMKMVKEDAFDHDITNFYIL